MGALAGVLVAAVLVAVAVIAWRRQRRRRGRGPGAELVALAAVGHDASTDGAQQIADHVGAEYKHADGQQLVEGHGRPARDRRRAARRAAATIKSYRRHNGVLYTLNGLGPNGSIKGGTPSTQRLQLVHREALELALYTFRYLPDADMVVTLLPPPPPKEGTKAAAPVAGRCRTRRRTRSTMTAVFYRPGDLKQRLQIPLGATLAAQAPGPGEDGRRRGPDGRLADALEPVQLVAAGLADGQPSLVLDRLEG